MAADDFKPLNLAQLYSSADSAVAQAMQTNLLVMQASHMKKEYDTEDALRSLAANSTTTDETGTKSFDLKSFTQGAYGIDTMKAIGFEKAASDADKTKLEKTKLIGDIDEQRMKAAGEKLKVMNNASTVPYMKWKELTDAGMPDQEARTKVQPMYEQALKDLADSGYISQDKVAALSQYRQFDPTTAEASMRHVLGVKDQLAQYWKEKDYSMKGQEFDETKRHHGVTEEQADVTATETARHHGAIEGDPTTIETTAQAIAAGNLAPLSGFALAKPMGQQIMARVMDINPNYSAKDFGTGQKAEKDFSTGKQGNAVRSFNVALSHLDTLDQLADAMHNGNTQLINKVGNIVATQTGKAAPVDFEAAKKIVADEIVKAIVGSGGGVGDREAAAKTINAANSPAQLKGVIGTYKDLMRGQLGGLRQQYETSTGRKDFDRFLSDSGKNVEHAGPKVSGASMSVTAPDGKTYSFPNQAAADAFKKAAGIQ